MRKGKQAAAGHAKVGFLLGRGSNRQHNDKCYMARHPGVQRYTSSREEEEGDALCRCKNGTSFNGMRKRYISSFKPMGDFIQIKVTAQDPWGKRTAD